MLTPREIERLGWATSAQASRAEWEMLLAVERAVREAIERGTVATSAQLQAALYEECRRIASERGEDIAEAATGEMMDAMQTALEHDLARAAVTSRAQLRDSIWAAQDVSRTLARAGLVAEARHVAMTMTRDAQTAYLGQTSRHTALVASGAETRDVAVARAFQALADRGVNVIEYASGHRDSPDVAVRRAIRTSVVQAGNAQTIDVIHAAGIRLIEVSSHAGARPSHAEWQGRIYADPGPATVDGVTYEDFGQGTGYYGSGPYGGIADRLCGVNCRHSFAPYVPGVAPMYSDDPDGDAGWDRETVYEDTQTQRGLERAIRKAKNRMDSLEPVRDTEAGARAYDAQAAKVRQLDAEIKRLTDSKDWLRRNTRLERSRREMAEVAVGA